MNGLADEIFFIEGIQYNFNYDDIKDLLSCDDELFEKYLYYLTIHRLSYLYLDSLNDQIKTFRKIINEDELTTLKLLNIYLKHENLFCNENGVRKLSLIPDKYKNKEFINY